MTYYHFFGMHLLWWLFWLSLLISVFFFDAAPKSRRDSPMRILKKRFAAGEISVKEYEERKAILERDTVKS